MTTAEFFDRAAALREAVARFQGRPEGSDPDGVSVTLADEDRPVVTMPLHVAERLLASWAAREVEARVGIVTAARVARNLGLDPDEILSRATERGPN